MFSRSISDNSMSVIDDAGSIIYNSRTIIDNSKSIIDDSRVTLQIVASFTIVIYNHHIFNSAGHWFS